MRTLLFILLPFLSFAQYGEGRLGRISEHNAHSLGGAAIGAMYYEVTRPKNSLNQTPDAYQRKELKQGLKALFVVAGAATVIEVADRLKGGEFSYSDWGATLTGGLSAIMFQCLGRMILQDRRDWRRKGLRLRL